jgi:pimeloyl-ACP methyl ester carboxylesterase
MSVILIEERIVHYETLGRGRPLIFLHGWLGSWRYWMHAMEAMSENYRTHAFDLWGYGDSDKQAGRYDLDAYLRLLETFMDQMGIQKAPLVAHSLGSILAVHFAARHPDRVPRLALVSTPLSDVGMNRGAVIGKSTFGKLQQKRQIDHEVVLQDIARSAPSAVEDSLETLKGFDLHPVIERLQMPALVVYGRKDALVDPGQVEELPPSNPSIRGLVMPDSRHFPMLDETSHFNRLLADFLETGEDLTHLGIKTEWRRRTR